MNAAVCPMSQPEVLYFEPILELPAEQLAEGHPPLAAAIKAPSCRDFEIYQQVMFEGMTQRKAAHLHKISQPRVNQILHDMAAWVADHTPGFAAELTSPQQLRLARYTFMMQLQNLRERAISAWEESRGVHSVSRTTVIGGMRQTVEYTRPSQGNARYLNEAAKIGAAMFKLEGGSMGMAVPAPTPNAGDWHFSDEEEQEVPDEVQTRPEETNAMKAPLSTLNAAPQAPLPSREMMQAITAKQEAVCDALQARLAQLEAQERELNNTLSLGTGPLIPEGKSKPARKRQNDITADRRRDFLHGEPPAIPLRERIDMKQ